MRVEKWKSSAQAAMASLCLISSVSCGANYAGIALYVQSIDATITKLEITPSVDGKVLPVELFTNVQGAAEYIAGFQLPKSYVGQSVSFDIKAINQKGCIYQSATASIKADALRRYDLKVGLEPVGGDKITNNLFDIHGSSPDNIWAVGDANSVVRWNGCYWKSVKPQNGNPQLIKLYVPPPNTQSQIIYGISLDKIYRYNGSEWALDYTPPFPVPDNEVDLILNGIRGNSDSDVWAVAGNKKSISPTKNNGMILRRDGTSWQKDISTVADNLSKNSITAIHVVNQTNILVAGLDGTPKWFVARWQVGNWRTDTAIPTISASMPSAIWGLTVNDYWIGGQPATVKRVQQTNYNTDMGYEAILPTGTGNPNWITLRLAGVDNNDIWTLNSATMPMLQSRVARYADNQWKLQSEIDRFTPQITSFHIAGKNDVWFVGYSGARIHFDGQKYTPAQDPQ